MESTFAKILAVAAGLGISTTLFFFMFRKYREEEYLISSIPSSRQTVLKIKVPRMSVGTIIGRGGSTIKSIQNATNTKINFGMEDDVEDVEKTIAIKGLPKDVTEAERLIMQHVSEVSAIEVYEMYIPHEACGTIIGRNGDNIRLICESSRAKVTVERVPFCNDNGSLRRVIIKGSIKQIETAKTMIEERIKLAESNQKKFNKSSSNNDGQPLLSITSSADDTQPYNLERCQAERLIPTCSDGFIEVFISAVEHPSHFWVQVVGTRAKELDKLVADLSEYYNTPSNQEKHLMEEIKVGDYVAARFNQDRSWYRAKITYVEEESYSAQEKKITVYYVDFGDSEDMILQEVFQLSEKFLEFPFQAIECSLANVQPKGGVWVEEGIQLFEQLTYVAQWVIVMAKPINPPDDADAMVPVKLIDTSGEKDVDVAEELVDQGYAVKKFEWNIGVLLNIYLFIR